MTVDGPDTPRSEREPSIWYLRLAVIAQSLTRRPLLVFVAFGLMGGFLLADLEPAWLPWVIGVMAGWSLLWVSRRIVGRARNYLALEEAPKPAKVRMR